MPSQPWDQASPAPVVLLRGKETYLADRAAARIRGILHAEDPALEVTDIDADTYTAGMLAQVASPSLFAEPRLIRVARLQAMSDAFLEDALAYVANPVPDTTVVMRHDGSSVRGKKLLDAIRASFVEITCAPITADRDRIAFARGEFQAEGRKIAQGALRALCDAFSNDLGELAAACQQLLQDTSGDVTEQTVSTYYAGRVETTAFDVVDSVISGHTVQALVQLRQAIAAGSDPVPIVAAFAMRFRQLAKVSAAQGSDDQAAKTMGMAPWQVRNARRDLRYFTDERLGNAIIRIAAADHAVKGAERSPIAALERLVRSL